MNLDVIFQDKAINAKAKVDTIGGWLLAKELDADELIGFADNQKASDKATCIEALEYATKREPNIAKDTTLAYVTNVLKDNEPRIKWESAKVIGNIAKLFQSDLKIATTNLLLNAENNGTVVRWATAYALVEILKLKTSLNEMLLPQILLLSEKEEDHAVKKKYLEALKKMK